MANPEFLRSANVLPVFVVTPGRTLAIEEQRKFSNGKGVPESAYG